MTDPRRVLIVCPRFAPVNAADMHRVRQSLPYFKDNGWDPIVLAVDPEQCDAVIDPMLEKTLPSDLEVVRVRVWPEERTRRVGFGSLALRAMLALARGGSDLIKTEAIDLVYFSTTAFPVLALGRYWKTRFGVPFVVDLQDPWRSDYYDQPGAGEPPGGSTRYGLSQYLARVLEPPTMRSAAHVISVSPSYPTMLMKRYEWMAPDNFTVLPFGAPELDFEVLSATGVRQSVFDPEDGLTHWVYVGRAGSDMRPALSGLFRALRLTRDADRARVENLRLHFVGTDYARGDRAKKTVEPIALEYGIDDLVEERPHRIPYFEALQCLKDADRLVVIGSDDPGYTASKLYPYVLARKPLLAIFHEESSVVDVLKRTNAGTVVTFSGDSCPKELADEIRWRWLSDRESGLATTNWSAFEPYTARSMTARQAAVFDNVLAAVAMN